MKIGVISDTHIPEKAKHLPQKIFELFSDVDLIFHAGDLTRISVIDELETLAKVETVRGNMDAQPNPYPPKKTFTIEGIKIGLLHGYGPPFYLRERIRKEFQEVEVIVYGHSHQPYNRIEKEILFFNPGSPTDKIFAPYLSVGILNIAKHEVRGEIIKI